MRKRPCLVLSLILMAVVSGAFAYQSAKTGHAATAGNAAESSEFDESSSEMRPLLEGYEADKGNLQRFYNIENSEERGQRLKKYYESWLARLAQLNFEGMHQDGKVEYITFRNTLEHELRALDIRQRQDADAQPLVPFAPVIIKLEVCRQKMEPLKANEAAHTLSKLMESINETRKNIEGQLKAQVSPEVLLQRKIRVAHALVLADSLRDHLRDWFRFYDGYDPQFTWWAAADYRNADTALQNYTSFLRERVLGLRPAGPGPNRPSGQGVGGQGAGGNIGGQPPRSSPRLVQVLRRLRSAVYVVGSG